MYYDDADNCVLVQCAAGEELVLLDKTAQCNPPPENPACTVQGTLDCCPVYTCRKYTYRTTAAEGNGRGQVAIGLPIGYG